MAVIKVQNLSKTFKIPHERRDSIKENFINLFRPVSYEKFDAVKNLSFSVNKGDFFGIIGRNGSGKSTLLKMLAGIYSPTKGKVKINGTIAPFLELGVGFNPELTGKENVYLNGSILGLSRRDIDSKYDKIVEFAGLEKFMDQKLKNYSSGMYVRLAFSVAIQADADVLLLDEVLAVGDADFQKKCFEVFRKLKKQGKTIVFVTHDLSAVRQFCNKAIYIKNGKLVASGKVNKVIDKYIYEDKVEEGIAVVEEVRTEENTMPEEDSVIVEGKKDMSRGGDLVEIKKVEFIDKFGKKNDSFITGDLFESKIYIKSKINVKSPCIGFIIYDEKDNYIFGSNNELNNLKLRGMKKGENIYSIEVKSLPLLTGRYYMTFAVSEYDYSREYVWKDKLHSFNVV